MSFLGILRGNCLRSINNGGASSHRFFVRCLIRCILCVLEVTEGCSHCTDAKSERFKITNSMCISEGHHKLFNGRDEVAYRCRFLRALFKQRNLGFEVDESSFVERKRVSRFCSNYLADASPVPVFYPDGSIGVDSAMGILAFAHSSRLHRQFMVGLLVA